jgi:hypothetical protein
LSQNQNNRTVSRPSSAGKTSFAVQVKGKGEAARARVVRVDVTAKGRRIETTWFVASFIPDYHEWWDEHRARRTAKSAMAAAQSLGVAR